MRTCTKCQTKYQQWNAAFCGKCGHILLSGWELTGLLFLVLIFFLALLPLL